MLGRPTLCPLTTNLDSGGQGAIDDGETDEAHLDSDGSGFGGGGDDRLLERFRLGNGIDHHGGHPPAAHSGIQAAPADSRVIAMLPHSIVASGRLTVVTTITALPDAFTGAGGAVVGLDADLAHALGQVLGLSVTLDPVPSGSVVTSVVSGRYDLGLSALPDTAAVEGKATAIDYLKVGDTFFVKAGSGRSFAGLSALCGASVGVLNGSTYRSAAIAQGKACSAAGNRSLTLDTYPAPGALVTAVTGGRTDVGVAASTTSDYSVAVSAGRVALAAPACNVGPYGMVASPSGGLRQAVGSALITLVADGTYTAIVSKWCVQSGAVTTAIINGVAG